MSKIKRGLAAALIGLFLTVLPAGLLAQDEAKEDPQAIRALLVEQNRKLSAELRHIRRDIAALRADLDKPGMKDVFSGIGYILGLFGAAAFVAARRKE